MFMSAMSSAYGHEGGDSAEEDLAKNQWCTFIGSPNLLLISFKFKYVIYSTLIIAFFLDRLLDRPAQNKLTVYNNA